jgi:hypothetical protein
MGLFFKQAERHNLVLSVSIKLNAVACILSIERHNLVSSVSIKLYAVNCILSIERHDLALALFLYVHCENRLEVFPSPARMPFTKLSLAWKNLIIPGQGEFGKSQPGWGRVNH